MEYCFLKGFLVILLIQHSTSEDSASIQSSTAVTLQEGHALPQEQEQPLAEVVPVVAPPSLKEVQQAVQEASEQVEGRGAEEVLKGLLERVVEAALGQVEGGGEAKADEAPQQETVVEEEIGAEKGEAENDTRMEGLELGLEEAVGSENKAAKETGTGEKEQVEVNVTEEEEEGIGGTEGAVEAVAGSEQGKTEGIEPGVSYTEVVEETDESSDTKFNQEVVEETVATIDETGGYQVEDNNEEIQLFEGNGGAEIESQEVVEPPVVAGNPEQETVVESDLSPAEQTDDQGGEETPLVEGPQGNETGGEVMVPFIDNDEMETTQSVIGEPVEGEEEGNAVNDTVEPEVEEEQGILIVGKGAADEVAEEVTEVKGADGAESHVDSVIEEESVLMNEGVGQLKAEEEEQIAVETSHDSVIKNQEILVISAPEPEEAADVSLEQSHENHNPSPSPSQVETETKENIPEDEKIDHGNEIITPTDELLPQQPIVVQPTDDNIVNHVLAEPPQAEGDEPGEANELVEAETTDKSELGMEAWKIGAISAAAFLVLETIIIIIYILKCRNKNSALALHRACEEGCVEPEATTGGDCSDDILPAGNGDTQQIAALDSSDVASTLAQNKAQHEEENAIAMSDLPPSSTEESENSAKPNSSPDLRTSVL